jgi:hypothetical protein
VQGYNEHVLKLFLPALLLLLCISTSAQSAIDSDRDGLSDDFEQALLAKFRPTLMTSAHDCAVRPARFKSAAEPAPEIADGTIYGQVFPVSADRVEVHYYALWDKDCGRISHPLDAEHVAALVSFEGAESKALYWYAGAHERTVCDISSGARAKTIEAESHGPTIWAASGKHALYFKKEMCSHGCGADSCEDDTELAQAGPVINVGELETPANGALFVSSPKWLLSTKMDSDFSKEMIALIESSPGNAISTVRGRSTVRGTIQGSDTVYNSITDSAATATNHTGAALDTADTHAANSLGKARKSTGNALTKAWRFVTGKKKDETKTSEKK